MKYEVLAHSSIKFELEDKIIYFDPFDIKERTYDADIIFITHSHYDHYSILDIKKILNKDTIIYVPYGTNPMELENIRFVKPGDIFQIDNIKIEVVKSYNCSKDFHKEEYGFVGYILTIDKLRYYIMGDSDTNKDNIKIKADYVFIPIGGTYTFDPLEAADYINKIKPMVAIATHYTFNEKKRKCIDEFKEKVDSKIKVEY